VYFRADVLRSTTTTRPSASRSIDQIERADQRAVEHLAGVQVDQRHVKRLFDAHDLGPGLLVPVEHLEHPAGEVEQAVLRVLLAEADRSIAGLDLPVALEEGLDIGEARHSAIGPAPEEEGRGAVDPGAEGERGRHELGLQVVHVGEPVLEGAAKVLVDLREAHVRLLAHLGWHHGSFSSERHDRRESRGSLACVQGVTPAAIRPRGASG